MKNYNVPIRKTISSPNLILLYSTTKGGGREKLFEHHPIRRSNTFSSLLIFFVIVFAAVSLFLYCSSNNSILYFSSTITIKQPFGTADYDNAIIEDLPQPPRGSLVASPGSISSEAVLLPDWEVLMIIETPGKYWANYNLVCLYPNNVTSPANFSGVLPSTNQATFKCFLPKSCRRIMPFLAPVLTSLPLKEKQVLSPKIILRWHFLAYESFSTNDGVVLFVKGVNNRQGINRSPNEFNCIFTLEDVTFKGNNVSIRTAVTSSVQEVFRCGHPDLRAFSLGNERLRIKISLEILEDKTVVPSVAYYNPMLMLAKSRPKHKICAATMVYNVGKFLREWVMYHKRIGVEKFILYDNDSDDNLTSVAKELNKEGYNVETIMWIWPKTQEAGFSHAALHTKQSCTWLMFVDVDEFIFAPSWQNDLLSSEEQTIKALLPEGELENGGDVGQVSVMCLEFGPSNQKNNPEGGVTQGYDCRRRAENRHKSIVLLEAIDYSLLNAIHHFTLKENYTTKQLRLESAAVNHYKFQAWSEFKAKFRRRVSAYVADWKQNVNPSSKDRTPGLGFEAKEPVGWETKFCEITDERLKLLTQRWFGTETETGYRMAWQ